MKKKARRKQGSGKRRQHIKKYQTQLTKLRKKLVSTLAKVPRDQFAFGKNGDPRIKRIMSQENKLVEAMRKHY